MGGGALMQLVANGSQDVYLTGNPQITYFRAVYKRYTNFAKETILQNTTGTLTQGSKFSVILGRHGDLLSGVTAVIKRKRFKVNKSILQQIDSSWTCDGKFYYPSAGYNFLEYVEVEIGGQIIDTQYGDWLNVWTDLTEPLDKKFILNQMLYSKSGFIPRNADIYNDGDIYLPLKFWFCTNPGLALPLIALQYHEVKINFSLTPSSFSSGKTVYVDKENLGSISNSLDMKQALAGTDISNNHVHNLENKVVVTISPEKNIIDDLDVYADYIYLDTEERRKFAKVKHEYLFEQIQTQGPKSIPTTSIREAVTLRFNHPVKELIWIIDNSSVGACGVSSTGERRFEIIKSGLLQLNGKDRFKVRKGTYFTIKQRYDHHSGSPLKYLFEAIYSGDLRNFKKNWDQFSAFNIPSEAIHTYSFALNPEKTVPSGTCNFSRLDNVVLELEFYGTDASNSCEGSVLPCTHPTPNFRSLWVFAINYNVLRIMSGMAGLVYCN